MTTQINRESPMRDEINKAVSAGMVQNKQLTEWRKVLFTILEQFNDKGDETPIVIHEKFPPSKDKELRFENKLEITLGQLRGMK